MYSVGMVCVDRYTRKSNVFLCKVDIYIYIPRFDRRSRPDEFNLSREASCWTFSVFKSSIFYLPLLFLYEGTYIYANWILRFENSMWFRICLQFDLAYSSLPATSGVKMLEISMTDPSPSLRVSLSLDTTTTTTTMMTTMIFLCLA